MEGISLRQKGASEFLSLNMFSSAKLGNINFIRKTWDNLRSLTIGEPIRFPTETAWVVQKPSGWLGRVLTMMPVRSQRGQYNYLPIY